MNPLNRQWFYRKFRKKLREMYGSDKAGRIWEAAGKEYESMLQAQPDLPQHKGSMVLPAVVLYRAMTAGGAGSKEAGQLLNSYGDDMGKTFAGIVHAITSIPGVSRILWKHIESIMDRMSGEALGYKRRLVSRPPEMYGVDILSCPYHELAKDLGNEEAVLCICHMDKAYMKGFHHIRYERTTAVSEGAEACDYRLRYDPQKN